MCRGIHCIQPSHKVECTILKPSEREIHDFTLPIPVESTQRKTHVSFFYNHYLCQQPLSMKLFIGIIGTLLRKPVLLQGLSSLQCDLHSALNCAIRLFIRLVIYQKTPKTPKINHRTSVIDCLRLVSSYWDPILSNFCQVLPDWQKPLLTNVSAFVLWPFVRSQSNREKNQTTSVQQT